MKFYRLEAEGEAPQGKSRVGEEIILDKGPFLAVRTSEELKDQVGPKYDIYEYELANWYNVDGKVLFWPNQIVSKKEAVYVKEVYFSVEQYNAV